MADMSDLKPAFKSLEGQFTVALGTAFAVMAEKAPNPWVQLGFGLLAALCSGHLTFSRTSLKKAAITAGKAILADPPVDPQCLPGAIERDGGPGPVGPVAPPA